MQPRHEVTIHLTKQQYEELRYVLEWGPSDTLYPFRELSEGLQVAMDAPVFDPLLDERVTVGSSFKRGQG